MADQDSTDNLCLKVHSGVSQSQSQWSRQLAHLSDQKSYYVGQQKGTGKGARDICSVPELPGRQNHSHVSLRAGLVQPKRVSSELGFQPT